jgi:hypothetical protein
MTWIAREKQVAQYRKEDEDAERERPKQREAARKVAVDAEEAKLKERYRMIFLSTQGSTNAAFEREWPVMLRQFQIEQTLGGLWTEGPGPIDLDFSQTQPPVPPQVAMLDSPPRSTCAGSSRLAPCAGTAGGSPRPGRSGRRGRSRS